MGKIKKYGRLNNDTAFFLKGTEFEITNEDDGFWSLNPFYAGRIDGIYVSLNQDDVDIIYDGSYTGKVIKAPEMNSPKEEWWEYTNYP